MGAISSYPANFYVANVQKEVDYYISVQGIGNDQNYVLSAKIRELPYTLPTNISMNDIPWTSKTIQYQYVDFYLNVEKSGNFTVQIFVENKRDTDRIYLLLLKGSSFPRMGNYDKNLSVSQKGTWEVMQIVFARSGMYSISVWADYSTEFYLQAKNNEKAYQEFLRK